MKIIPLRGKNGEGKFALVSDEDYAILSSYKWHIHPGGYVVRSASDSKVYMHRQITNAPNGVEVDHVNHDRLDNQRHNLRLATSSQNHINRLVPSRSGYRGVFLLAHGKYKASITCNHVQRCIGHFDTALEAARAYNEQAKKLHGEFAILNDLGTNG
jgi:hypothetical protein